MIQSLGTIKSTVPCWTFSNTEYTFIYFRITVVAQFQSFSFPHYANFDDIIRGKRKSSAIFKQTKKKSLRYFNSKRSSISGLIINLLRAFCASQTSKLHFYL